MNTQQRSYMIIALFVVAALVMGVFLIYPLFTQIAGASSDILQKRGELASVDDQNSELDDFRQKYVEYKPNLQKVDALFIDSKDPINFITFLETSADDAGVILSTTLLPVQGKGTGPWPSFVFQISAGGKYPGMLDFLEKLEINPYLTRTRKLSLRPHPSEGDKEKSQVNQVDADIVIEVFAN